MLEEPEENDPNDPSTTARYPGASGSAIPLGGAEGPAAQGPVVPPPPPSPPPLPPYRFPSAQEGPLPASPSEALADRTAKPRVPPRATRPLPAVVLARYRRWHLDTPRGRLRNRTVGLALVLLGLAVAIADNAGPEYQTTLLAPSGSFYALTEAGNTLYAASSNGGSILLEKSTDRGNTWSPTLVPLYAVSGGAPWDLAVVAADGNDLVLTAASGLTGSVEGSGYPGSSEVCNQNSTILLASSQNGGATWTSQTVTTPAEVVTSLQAAIEGAQAAVAWIQQPVGPCGAAPGEVSTITSSNSGASWSLWQNLSEGASLSSEESLQMAPEGEGIVVAFLEQLDGSSSSSLSLWLYPQGSAQGFLSTPFFLPAPTSWTLQGDPGTPALLVTPTYLVPLSGSSLGSLTAIPFYQLQQDAASTGALPQLVSVVPLSNWTFEIAATMPQGMGVDCWSLNLLTEAVSQLCHVPLGSLLQPSSEQFPIVALLDGGGYWVAIGASGSPTCYDVCPVSTGQAGGGTLAPTSAGAAAVGTSVCIEGCGTSQGLAAYAFTENTPFNPLVVSVLAFLVVVLGLAWLATTRRARRRMEAAPSPKGTQEPAPSGNAAPSGPEPRRVLHAYRQGLLVWVVAWTPMALLIFVSGSSSAFGLAPALAVAGGILGGLVALPFHSNVRRTLQRVYGVRPESLFVEDPSTAGPTQDKVRLAALFAYMSWVAGLAVVLLFTLALVGGLDRSSGAIYGGASGTAAALGSGAFVLVGAVVAVVLFRWLYHVELADAVALVRAQMTTGSEETPLAPGVVLRDRLGAGLMVLNPFIGLLLGWAVQPAAPALLSFLPWVFLPTTLLGIALLFGLLGPTSWAVEPATAPA